MDPTAATATHPTGTTARRRARALAVGGAALAGVPLWLIAQVLGIELWVDPSNGQPPGVIPLPALIGFSLAFSLLGWGALALLERFTSRALTIWTVLAVAVLLLSMLPVLAVEATLAAKVMLALMHVAVAAVLIPGLRRSAPGRSAP